MAVIAGDLVTRLGVDGRKFQSGLDKARSQTRSFATDVTKIVSGIVLGDIATSLTKSLASMAISTVSLAADAEVMRAEFSVLLGDVGKGAKMFADLEKFAARTSFDLTSAGDAARQLMASGVKEGNLLDTMQLLGDLSLGDANRLGFLAKAYTDVLNKGKLQGQELRQFAENNVGLVAALATMLKKQPGEIAKMAEAGQISFTMMDAALRGLTAEGGRFFGAMEARNKTLRGQWDSLLEGIQKTGRAIGDAMLPQLKLVVTEINGMLGKFNEMPNRLEIAKKLIVSAFEIGVLTMQDRWGEFMEFIIDQTRKTAPIIARIIKDEGRFLFGEMIRGQMEVEQRNVEAAIQDIMRDKGRQAGKADRLAPLEQAKADFNDVLKQLQPNAADKAAAAAAAPPSAPKKAPIDGAQVAGALGDLFGALKPIGAGIEQYIGTKIQEGKIAAGGLMGTFDRWFNGDKKKAEPQIAGAMEKGSQEAYSAIVQSMLRSADPTVKAIQTQTKELVKKLKPKDQQKMVAMGAVN